jgi:hypothetical protein
MVDQSTAALIENVVIRGDISKLSAAERNHYYQEVCRSCGLNPLTRPFEYLVLSGKMVLYARKDATDQLRTIHKVSVDDLKTELRGDVFVVTVKVRNGEGRTDMATGAVTVGNLKGDALANAMMKAETKAKRRATLSICGLGLLDETELETIPEKAKLKLPPTPSRPIPPHDPTTGELDDEIPYTFPAAIPDKFNSQEGNPPRTSTVATEAGASDSGPEASATSASDMLRFRDELRVAAEEGSEGLRLAWKLIPPKDKPAMEGTKNELKKRAKTIDDAREVM